MLFFGPILHILIINYQDMLFVCSSCCYRCPS